MDQGMEVTHMVTKLSSELGKQEIKTSEVLKTGEERRQSVPGTARLVSLDAFRGFIMFWIVGGGELMLGLQALGHNRIIDFLIYELSHSPWEGLRFYDCIWPSFMLMVGISVPFAYAKRSLTETHSQMLAHALRRFAVLFLLGSLRESVHLGAPYLVELSSALQPIAIAYLVAFLLVRKSPKFQAAVGGSILVGYALLLAFVPTPGIGAGSYRLNANLVYAVDLRVLPHRASQAEFLEGWGTILSTLPTISTTILGLLIGELLRSPRPAKTKIKVIGMVGLSGLVLGWALSFFIPVVMKMWTTSYGILSASWACLMFLSFYWVIDVLGYRKWTFPLVVIGTNALAVYLSHTLIPLHHIVGIFTKGAEAALGSFGPLFGAVVFIGVEWLILYWMYKRKIILSA
jgi:predicted acyltransferase